MIASEIAIAERNANAESINTSLIDMLAMLKESVKKTTARKMMVVNHFTLLYGQKFYHII